MLILLSLFFSKWIIIIIILSLDTIALVNDQLAKGEEGRLFAVIHVAGKQFVVTQEDIIIIHGSWPPSIGDQVKFEKVGIIS